MESSKIKHLMPRIASNYLSTMIISYTYYYDEAIATVPKLSTKGREFVQGNINQLNHFC
jgi:hypothetical protein